MIMGFLQISIYNYNSRVGEFVCGGGGEDIKPGCMAGCMELWYVFNKDPNSLAMAFLQTERPSGGSCTHLCTNKQYPCLIK
jgi:hypothetical protein